MKITRIVITLALNAVALSSFALAGMPGQSDKSMCAMACHNSGSKPAHPNLTKQDAVQLLSALQQFKGMTEDKLARSRG